MKAQGYLVLIVIILGTFCIAKGQNNYPPQFASAVEKEYKNVDGISLKLWVFNPPNSNMQDKKPAIIFFFGGGWRTGNPGQFEKHCEYLAARGMVAITADYRVKNRHGVSVNKCVSDAKSAVRWVREHASELGIDPKKIAAGGGSAGGHLAAATATLPKFDETNENKSISSKPNALMLFNPALVVAPVDNMNDTFKKKMEGLEQRMGAKPETISPYHNITAGVPPCIIFHGTGDTTVPFFTVEMFTKKMKSYGNDCILVGYDKKPHGFFNYGRNRNGAFVDTVNKMDKFFISQGYLEPLPSSKLIR